MADLSGSIAAAARRLKCASLYAPAQALGLDNPDWESASARFLVVRLSPWRDVDRSTPHLFLHRLIRASLGSGPYVDFAFFPSKSDRAVFDSAGVPWLSGVSARRTADEYDAVLVSFSYALELVNLPSLLVRSGIPSRASARRASLAPSGRPWPPIVLGGSSALACQGGIFPDGDAFFDAVFFGEAESGGAEVVRSLAATRGRPTAERAAELEAVSPAVWAAAFGPPGGPRADGTVRRVRPGRCAAAGDGPVLLDSYPLLNSEEASTCRLQISWGCPSFCAFCFEGWERKPYRELPIDRAVACARSLARNTGASTVEIYSFNFNAHERCLELIRELNRVFDRVNMMSQRADILAKTHGMLAAELAAEKRSYTVGVEGISASMRAFYSKGLTDSDLRGLLEKLAREKIRELKLFYIVSGMERGDDIAEFRAFCGELKELVDSRNPSLRVVFSAGYLVRMPFTPLRGVSLALDRSTLESIAGELRDAVEGRGFEFRIAQDWDEYLADQLMVAGGYALAAGVEEAAAAGAVYDTGLEGGLLGSLVRALRSAGELDPPASGASADLRRISGPLTEAKDTAWRYPLDFVDPSVGGGFLDLRRADADSRRDAGTCMGDDGGDGACLGCSACGDDDERAFLSGHRVSPGSDALARRLASEIREKRRARPAYVRLVLPRRLEGALPSFLSAWLMRAALGREESLVGRLLRVEEALWNSPRWRDRIGPGATGETVVALYGLGDQDEAGNPRIAKEDAEKALAAFEAATGSSASLLEDFSPDDLVAVNAKALFADRAAALAGVRKWLSSLKLAATERKTDDGMLFEIAPKDRKKRIVDSVSVARDAEDRALVRISGGAKLDLSALLPSGTYATDVTFSRR